MNLFDKYRWMTASAFLLLTGLAAAAEPPPLAHNPFSRPPSAVLRADAARSLDDDGALTALDLRATMVASRDRLANVGGRILRPGDDIQGYKLLQVYEDRAVFARNENRLTVFVKPDLVESDE